ncbi:MAG: alpha/beta hydrolase [Solirubrobacteraceae bacterium]
MRLRHIIATCLLLAALFGARPAAAGLPRRQGRVVVLRPHRAGLAGASEIWVYRPPGRDSAALPVLYYLHGNPGLPSDLFHAGLKSIMDRYIARGGRPFVVAAPDGNSSRHFDTEWGDASDGTDFVESFLLDRVIPMVEGRYPRDASRRAIAGFSMGGFGAMNIALQRPDLFGQIVSVAGYFSLDDPNHVFATAQSQLLNSPSANISGARGKRILLLEDRDERLAAVRGQSARFDAGLATAGIPAALYVARGGHDVAYEIRQLSVIQHFLAIGWAAIA